MLTLGIIAAATFAIGYIVARIVVAIEDAKSRARLSK